MPFSGHFLHFKAHFWPLTVAIFPIPMILWPEKDVLMEETYLLDVTIFRFKHINGELTLILNIKFLALPAAVRPRLEPRCYLAFGQDMCVDVLSADAFEAEAAEVLAKVRRGEMDRNQMRALASNMVEVSIDAQGRINIEEQLREYAGLSLNSKVVVSGAFDRVEIWEPLRFGRINTKGTVQIAGADA